MPFDKGLQYGKEVLKDVDDLLTSTKQNLTRRSLLSNHIKEKIKTLFSNANTLDGEQASQKFKVPQDHRTQAEKRLRAQILRFNPLKDPDYIKRAKEDPKTAYQYHMNVAKFKETIFSPDELEKMKRI